MLQNSKHGKRRMPIMHLSLSTLLLMAPLSLMASPLEGHRVADINEAMMAQQQSSKVNQRTITGTVTDANGEPIVGATVVEHGKKSGTITNGDGKFTLTVTPGNTLTISYVGFATQTVKVRDAMRVTMAEDAQGLDEVVVVGYGTMKKRDLPVLPRQPTCLQERQQVCMCAKTRHNLVAVLTFSSVVQVR